MAYYFLDVAEITRRGALVGAVALLAGCGSGGAPPPVTTGAGSPPGSESPSAGPERAVADLDELLRRLEVIHPEPFHGVPREEFVGALRGLQGRLATLSTDETTVAVMRLVAMLSREGRDGHQFVLPRPGSEGDLLPLGLWELDGGLLVTAALGGDDRTAGASLVRIGDHPVEDVLAAVEPLVPRDGPATVPSFRPLLVRTVAVLRGLDLVDDGPVRLGLERDGERFDVAVDPVTHDEFVSWAGDLGGLRLPQDDRARFRRYEDVMWSERLPGSTAVYWRITRIRRPDPEAQQQVRDLLGAPDVDRVLLDLRQNPGGDNTNNGATVATLQQLLSTRAGARLVLLTDRVTFSAASNLATDVERALAPVVVGEAMGGGLNFWDDVTQVGLDHLPVPLQVGVSTRYWERSTPDDPRLTIEPHLPVALTAHDVRTGLDPALDVALGPLP